MAPSRSGGPSNSTRPRRSRTQVDSYQESDDENSPTVSLRSRSHTQRTSYREVSSDQESDDEELSVELDEDDRNGAELQPSPPTSTRRINRSNRTRASNRTRRSNNTARGTKRRTREPLKHKDSVANKRAKYYSELLDDLSRFIPPWQTLPYHILFEIFLQATYPTPNEKWEARSDMARWLVNIACLCREFQEPALAALYHCPPLFPSYKCHALVNLLSMPRESLLINYAGKIKELHLDVDVLRYKSGPILGYFDLTHLIQKIPQVHAVRIYHQDDFTLGHQPSDIPPSKWLYSENLFEAMDSTGIRLRAWDWNSRFLNLPDLLPFILKQHHRPAFQRLKEVKLLHLGDRNRHDTEENEDALASALQALPDLKRLEFVECTLPTDRLLLRLPSTICSITITNCNRIMSPFIEAFLKSHGNNLRELNLNHNRHLDLQWMRGLAEYCPSLEKVKFDGNIYDASPHNDTMPHFFALMRPDIGPTWPHTLREIEMTCLRKLDSNCAETFLSSLLNVSSHLCDLRRLSISMILDMSWRDRAKFRDTWVPEIVETFQSKDLVPRNPEPSPFPESSDAILSRRQSTRIANISEKRENSPGYSAPEAFSPGRQTRGPRTCDEVFIRIDNQRPSETQFNENDFLDSEASGDEDWDGE